MRSGWEREWVRCQFECNFGSVVQQICFHLTHSKFHWCCSVSVVMTPHFAQTHCRFFTIWPTLDVTSCPDWCIVSVVLWTELLIVRISVKDNWQPHVREIKWDFDLTIYISVHIIFLSNMVAHCFSVPLSNSAVTVLQFAVSTDYTCYLLNTFCTVMC